MIFIKCINVKFLIKKEIVFDDYLFYFLLMNELNEYVFFMKYINFEL